MAKKRLAWEGLTPKPIVCQGIAVATPRRFLPSMQLLRAFEACARLSNFTAAARELSLTQSAVSRQVRALEQQLGGALFLREKQTARLTLAGQTYAREVREVLQRLATATLGFRAHPQGGTLRLATPPAFAARWLAPRLPDLLCAHPDLSIQLITQLAPQDLRFETIDAAIHYGPADWPGVQRQLLLPETVVPACSDTFRQHHHIASAQDLLRVPLLHLASRPDAWERWFHAQSVACGAIHGMLIDQFGVAAGAAIAGLGVALLPVPLFEEEFERGDLVRAIDAPLSDGDGYYLTYPGDRADYPPLTIFRGWAAAQTSAPMP